MKNLGKTLKIYVMGSDPHALRTVELYNWTGLAFVGQRRHLKQVKEIEKVSETGIYLLLSDDSDEGGLTDIYIGETDNFGKRLSDHNGDSGKDWWNRFVVFVSKDLNLTKSHVRYLESELYKLAHQSITTLRTKNTSEPGGSRLPKSDESAMQEFLGNMLFVLESLGLTYFSRTQSDLISMITPISGTLTNGTSFQISLPKKFALQDGGQPIATMQVVDGRYILKAGSYIRAEATESLQGHNYYDLWKKIIESELVSKIEGTSVVRAIKDIEFRAPSAAAAVVRGNQTNGRTEWKRLSDGKSLGECETEVEEVAGLARAG